MLLTMLFHLTILPINCDAYNYKFEKNSNYFKSLESIHKYKNDSLKKVIFYDKVPLRIKKIK